MIDIKLKIDNVTDGFHSWGYWVISEPTPGEENLYYEELKKGLLKVEERVKWLHTNGHCRGRSKRTLKLLHTRLPDPCWGVQVEPSDPPIPRQGRP